MIASTSCPSLAQLLQGLVHPLPQWFGRPLPLSMADRSVVEGQVEPPSELILKFYFKLRLRIDTGRQRYAQHQDIVQQPLSPVVNYLGCHGMANANLLALFKAAMAVAVAAAVSPATVVAPISEQDSAISACYGFPSWLRSGIKDKNCAIRARNAFP